MPSDLPPALQEALKVVGGQSWPEGDQDGLNRIADHWQEMVRAIEELETAVRDSANGVSQHMRGQLADAYRNYADSKVIDSLEQLKQTAQQLSDQARNTAADIQKAKISIGVQLGFVAASLLATFIPIIGGAITGGVVATARVAIGAIIRGVVANVSKNVVRNVAIGEALGTGTEVAVQGAQIAGGQLLPTVCNRWIKIPFAGAGQHAAAIKERCAECREAVRPHQPCEVTWNS